MPYFYCFAARQKEMATSSVTELVQAVKRPRALSESTDRPVTANGAPDRRHSVAGTRASMQKISELPEKKHKKSARQSFMA